MEDNRNWMMNNSNNMNWNMQSADGLNVLDNMTNCNNMQNCECNQSQATRDDGKNKKLEFCNNRAWIIFRHTC